MVASHLAFIPMTGRFIHTAAHDLASLIARSGQIFEQNLPTMRLVE